MILIFLENVKLFVNRGDPKQKPRFVVSDQGLYCLSITFLVSPDYNTVNMICTHSLTTFDAIEAVKLPDIVTRLRIFKTKTDCLHVNKNTGL